MIKESGRPINAYEAIGRNFMRAVDMQPGILYGFGLVCMMLNKQSRRLGDFVAGTWWFTRSRARRCGLRGIRPPIPRLPQAEWVR